MIYFLVDSMKTVLKEQKKEVRQFFFHSRSIPNTPRCDHVLYGGTVLKGGIPSYLSTLKEKEKKKEKEIHDLFIFYMLSLLHRSGLQ